MWIFSSRHRLHLLSKDFGVLGTIVCQGLTLYLLILNNVLIEQFDFLMLMGEGKFMISISNFPTSRRNANIIFLITYVLFWINNSLIYYII